MTGLKTTRNMVSFPFSRSAISKRSKSLLLSNDGAYQKEKKKRKELYLL